MTRIEEILSRALLVRDRKVPRDIVPSAPTAAGQDRPAGSRPASTPNAAAEDLRALCETLVTHTPATDVADFVTDQLPEPRSALILACVLELTDTSDGARFWWQYAAGAGHAAAYCLYLHHLALGERDTADWWHRQTDDVQPSPKAPVEEHHPGENPDGPWRAAEHRITSTSTTTILRVLRHLAKYTVRPRPAAVTQLMTYVPKAVAVGYLRQPEVELPMPGPDFARRISTLIATAANRPDVFTTLPARPGPRVLTDTGPQASASTGKDSAEAVHPQMGETAKR